MGMWAKSNEGVWYNEENKELVSIYIFCDCWFYNKEHIGYSFSE
jgi:hypothetical protein